MNLHFLILTATKSVAVIRELVLQLFVYFETEVFKTRNANVPFYKVLWVSFCCLNVL